MNCYPIDFTKPTKLTGHPVWMMNQMASFDPIDQSNFNFHFKVGNIYASRLNNNIDINTVSYDWLAIWVGKNFLIAEIKVEGISLNEK